MSMVFENENHISVKYDDINPNEKWRLYLYHEETVSYNNLINLSNFCVVSRGIATGANDFYCFNKTKIREKNIPDFYFEKCICRSADVKSIIFTENDFNALAEQDKMVYLLDIKDGLTEEIKEYIRQGEEEGVNNKYLPASRVPWYTIEQKSQLQYG